MGCRRLSLLCKTQHRQKKEAPRTFQDCRADGWVIGAGGLHTSLCGEGSLI